MTKENKEVKKEEIKKTELEVKKEETPETKKKSNLHMKLTVIISLIILAIACFVVLFAVGIVDLVSSLISSVIILAIAVVILCFELGHKWHEN